MKRLLILGSTGSIGTQALDVMGDGFELVGLSAGTAHEALVAQARAHGVKRIALSDPDAAARAAEEWTDGEVLGGAEGLVELVAQSDADLETVTVEEALQHPTWEMGGKITIDSATLMNKGLEVIEAHHLFGTPYEAIDVVVHPQSIIHALVTLCDGAALAHLGHPDMRVPIAYALNYPERVDVPGRRLDLAEVGSLTFEAPDEDAFPCLQLARDAAEAGGTGPCVLNAANEVAVHAFLGGRLPFMGIPAVIEDTLDRVGAARVHGFDSLYQADAEARRVAGERIPVRA